MPVISCWCFSTHLANIRIATATFEVNAKLHFNFTAKTVFKRNTSHFLAYVHSRSEIKIVVATLQKLSQSTKTFLPRIFFNFKNFTLARRRKRMFLRFNVFREGRNVVIRRRWIILHVGDRFGKSSETTVAFFTDAVRARLREKD